ncbi:hypothetical protein V501_01890 [Pseudogymnoascus sp. VKM F-4519 (FW-2642)]|nr:hypothetical protein V500_03151 [Pseudogymnoascus sp. VKM F-4518 (FW-2643)]KFZ17099.1 hypothetical protein V501_01890 [Pseudogymnoascus sp. VKM F-4519 (FW-2642)]
MANGIVKFSYVSADGIDIFYREAGSADKPTLLLLHGFPSSSYHFRNLMPLLEAKYHVVAPDIPGFGFTVVPESRAYQYSFANFATTIEAFLDKIGIKNFSVYIFDYGAPVALRLALRNPERVSAIITQNGNAYSDGLGPDFWGQVQKYWQSGSKEDREALIPSTLSFDATKWQYEFGTARVDQIAPEIYHLDYALLCRPGNEKIQLDLFKDYETNVSLYPAFQEYFRSSQVPLLAAWGKNDIIFPPAGAMAYLRDLPKAEVHLLDAGHMATETNTTEIAELVLDFLGRQDL